MSHQFLTDRTRLYDATVTYKTIFGTTKEWQGLVLAKAEEVHEAAVQTARKDRRGLGAISEVCGSVAVECMWEE